MEEYERLVKGPPSENCCTFWSVFNALPERERVAFAAGDAEHPNREFLRVLGHREGYDETQLQEYLIHLRDMGHVKDSRVTKVEPYPKHIVTKIHRREGTIVILGKSPTGVQKTHLENALDKPKVTDRDKKGRSSGARGHRVKEGSKKREKTNQRRRDEEVQRVKTFQKGRRTDKPNHAVGIRFVEAPEGYPDKTQKRDGGFVPFLYDNGREKGWPATMTVLNGSIIDVNRMYLIEVFL